MTNPDRLDRVPLEKVGSNRKGRLVAVACGPAPHSLPVVEPVQTGQHAA
jgi:hypothetical protein